MRFVRNSLNLFGVASLVVVGSVFFSIHAAGPAFLVKDVNSTTPVVNDAFPLGYVEMGGHLYFFTRPYTGFGDLELWRTDGTPGGTVLVRELQEGYPRSPRVVGSRLFFFVADDLWVSDGTTSGTVNIETFPNRTDDAEIVDLNGVAYFEGWDADHGKALWRSDGTPDGTHRFSSLPPRNLTVVVDELYFTVTIQEITGSIDDVWKTDGTLVSRVTAGFLPTRLGPLAAFQGQLVFVAGTLGSGNGLWVTDGTEAGTLQILELDSADSGIWPDARLVEWGGHLYFYARDADHGYELWRTNGTAPGTGIVADLLPGPDSSSPCHLTPGPDGLLFTVDSVPSLEPWSGCESISNGATQRQLWKTDGTAAGTSFVTDVVPEPEDYLSPSHPIVELGGIMYFGRDTDELWRTDGTAEGTWLVATFEANLPYFYSLTHLGVFDGRLWFSSNDPATGYELWSSDGVSAESFKNLAPDLTDADPELLGTLGGRLFFSATDGAGGRKLWITDGTPGGTIPLAELDAAAGRGVAEVAGELYFAEATGCDNFVWKSDGTPAGTVSLGSPAGCPSPTSITAIGQEVFFSADSGGANRELWKTGGVPYDWSVVAEINPDGPSNPGHLVELSGAAYFRADDGESGPELWLSDGTAAGTELVGDFRPGASGSYPVPLSTHDGFLYFTARAGQPADFGLWRTDGSSAGTSLVSSAPGSGSGLLDELHTAGGGLAFSASSSAAGAELWITDGTPEGTTVLRDIRPGAAGSAPGLLGSIDGRLYLTANDGNLGHEIWTSDGTEAGTLLLKDIAPGRSGSTRSTRSFTASPQGARALFVASDGTHGKEIWQTNGTAAATTMTQDVAPGPVSGVDHREPILFAGGLVYFVADDGISGKELWAMPLFAPGEVADGSLAGDEPLRLGKSASSRLDLVWDDSTCAAGTVDYAVYEGVLGQPASSQPVTCSTAGLTSATITPGAGDRFFLVVPTNASTEGSYGRGSNGAERPVSPVACAVQWLDTVCE